MFFRGSRNKYVFLTSFVYCSGIRSHSDSMGDVAEPARPPSAAEATSPPSEQTHASERQHRSASNHRSLRPASSFLFVLRLCFLCFVCCCFVLTGIDPPDLGLLPVAPRLPTALPAATATNPFRFQFAGLN